ncbi:hypothetical protein OGATHE_001634 [Ogataea polymorpha]|uniref:Secreted protein n=1 Tax=Ogataea polymorpha TaxID=460523 RepID=A0A9P8PPR6_9ASCO|nr:hypothetical protein OGATHE_001634 [Ogataea polymorpha]
MSASIAVSSCSMLVLSASIALESASFCASMSELDSTKCTDFSALSETIGLLSSLALLYESNAPDKRSNKPGFSFGDFGLGTRFGNSTGGGILVPLVGAGGSDSVVSIIAVSNASAFSNSSALACSDSPGS